MQLMQLNLAGVQVNQGLAQALDIHMVDLNNRVLAVNFHLKVCSIASLKKNISINLNTPSKKSNNAHSFSLRQNQCSSEGTSLSRRKIYSMGKHNCRYRAGRYRSASEKFYELNPKGLVPVIIDDNLAIPESLVIIEYLEERYGGDPKLKPL